MNPAMRSQLVPCLALMGVLTLLSVPVIFYGLGDYGLVNGDEGVYHSISRNMLESGNWWRLEFTGEHRVYDTFMNSPLQYWLRGNVIRVLGDNYWSMRISSAVFAWLSVLALFTLVWWMATPRAAFLAALAQLTTFQFIYQHGARTGELEPFVCFLLIAAALTFLRGIFEGRSFALHVLCIGLLANFKMPLVILPLLADLAFFAVASEHRPHLRRCDRSPGRRCPQLCVDGSPRLAHGGKRISQRRHLSPATQARRQLLSRAQLAGPGRRGQRGVHPGAVL